MCGFSSSGRAPPCQGGGSEFDPRNPLKNIAIFLKKLLTNKKLCDIIIKSLRVLQKLQKRF